MKARDPEVARIARLLKSAILLSEQSQRSIERQMGLSPGYLGRIIDGKLELRIAHILGVCRAIRLPPAAFFLAAYPETLNLEPETMRLVQALQHLHRQRNEGDVKEAAPAPPAAAPDRERLEQTMKDFLDVLFTELAKGTPVGAVSMPLAALTEPEVPPPAQKGRKPKKSGG